MNWLYVTLRAVIVFGLLAVSTLLFVSVFEEYGKRPTIPPVSQPSQSAPEGAGAGGEYGPEPPYPPRERCSRSQEKAFSCRGELPR